MWPLSDAFLKGLSETLRDHLAPLDLTVELNALIALPLKLTKDFTCKRENGKVPADSSLILLRGHQRALQVQKASSILVL